jgi:nucleoside 2-deoxyribosyltransferase
MNEIQAYVAGPLGFSEAGRYFYYDKLLPTIKEVGFQILDPWALTDQSLIDRVLNLPYGSEKKKEWQKVNRIIGHNNNKAIRRCHILIGALDGPDVDSGTAGEIGLAYGLGKAIEGYRGDFRLASDNEGGTVNLQVEYFIREGGGRIASTLNELAGTLERRYQELRQAV